MHRPDFRNEFRSRILMKRFHFLARVQGPDSMPDSSATVL